MIIRNTHPSLRRVVSLALLLTLLALLLAGSALAAPLQQTVYTVYVTNVNDTSFVVSWTTDVPSDGHVDWGTTTALGNTESDPVVNTTMHYITVSGLSANNTYYFQARSGTTTDDNGGAYYSVTTGPGLGIPVQGKGIYGFVYESDGTTPLGNAIVYLQLQDNDGSGDPGESQWASVRTDAASGAWFYTTLGAIRTADYQSYFGFSDGTDNLRIVWQGGAAGTWGPKNSPVIISVPGAAEYPYQIDQSVQPPPTAIEMSDFNAYSTSDGAIFGMAFLLIVLAMALMGAFLLRRAARS